MTSSDRTMLLPKSKNIFISIKQYIPFLILLFSAIILPYRILPISHSQKYGLLSAAIILFFSLKIFKSKNLEKKWEVGLQDCAWILFVAFSFCSIAWASNSFYALYGAFQVLSIFLVFQVFSLIQWNEKNIKWIKNTVLIVAISALIAEYHSFQELLLPNEYTTASGGFKKIIAQTYKLNHNYVGSMIVILMCFLIFKKENKFSFSNIALFTTSAIIIILSDSAQVTIALFILLLIKLLVVFRNSKKLKIGLFVIASFMVIGIATTSKQKLIKTPVVHEFFDESDRLRLWSNSIGIFKSSPVVGVGVNNWHFANGKYGYNGYDGVKSHVRFNRHMHAHNFFFQFISELGLLGLLLLFTFAVWPVLKSSVRYKSLTTFQNSALLSLYLLFFLAMMYGVVYNRYNFFRGTIIVGTMALAIISNSSKKKLFSFKERHASAIFLMLALSTSFFFYKSNQATKDLARADLLIKNNKYEQALGVIKNVERYSDKAVTQLKISKSYSNLNDQSASLKAINTAVENDPYNLTLNLLAAQKKFQSDQVQQALDQTLFAQKLNPKYYPTTTFLAKIYAKTNDIEKFNLLYEDLDKSFTRDIRKHNKHLPLEHLNDTDRKKIRKELKSILEYQKQLQRLKQNIVK